MSLSKIITGLLFVYAIFLLGISCSNNSTGSGGSHFYKIAFVHEENYNQDIYSINSDGTELTRLTDSDANEYRPIWSPDGKYIYYQINFSSNAEIYRMDIDGSNKTNITNSDGWENLCDISPDGNKLLYYMSPDISNNNIYYIDLMADSSVLVTTVQHNFVGYVHFTPDGNNILYTHTGTHFSEIYMVRLDGSVTTTIADNMYINYDPQMSPNGQKIAYVATNPETYIGDIALCDFDGTDHINISFSSFNCNYPCWSPDGKKLVYTESKSGGEANIMIMNSDGTDKDSLTTSDTYNFYPEWSPDGSKIVYVNTGDGDLELYIMNPDGSEKLKLTDNGDRDEMPVWSPGL